MVASRSEGHRITANQGAYVGSRPGQVGGMGDELTFTPIKHMGEGIPETYIFDGDRLLLRIGKWKVKIVQIIPDEDFIARGLTAPGWDAENKCPTTKPGSKTKKDTE